MTRHTFAVLQNLLDFNGNTDSSCDFNDDKTDCCHQVSPLTEMKCCRKLYYSKKQLSVGKSLVLFKFQLYFKKYTKEKKSFRIKLYKLTSSNGIKLNFFS